MPETPLTYRTKSGKVLTDPDIEAMADEAEAGYDVDLLRSRRRGRPRLGSGPAEVVAVRLDPDLRQAVQACADSQETTPSEIIRRALRHYITTA